MNKSQLIAEVEAAGLSSENKQKLLQRLSVYPENLEEVHKKDILGLLSEISNSEANAAEQLAKMADAIDAIVQKSEIEHEQALQRIATDAQSMMQQAQPVA